jgi:hypothetical protein
MASRTCRASGRTTPSTPFEVPDKSDKPEFYAGIWMERAAVPALLPS